MNTDSTQHIFGLLSALLQYPDDEWQAELPFIRTELDAMQDEHAKHVLLTFLERVHGTDAILWQDSYVRTFDFGKSSNLYLTHEQQGQDRERGRYLLELKGQYAEAGFYLESSELPDYLPVVLEFASAASWDAAVKVLEGKHKSMRTIHHELADAGSPYANLLELLLKLIPEELEAHAEPSYETLEAGRPAL